MKRLERIPSAPQTAALNAMLAAARRGDAVLAGQWNPDTQRYDRNWWFNETTKQFEEWPLQPMSEQELVEAIASHADWIAHDLAVEDLIEGWLKYGRKDVPPQLEQRGGKWFWRADGREFTEITSRFKEVDEAIEACAE